ncbi:MAG: M23 family metallopeptidase, partial [Actinomycetota bacterium]|nr:M23 family metallopeptidase [Actinomycetota bacterium]
ADRTSLPPSGGLSLGRVRRLDRAELFKHRPARDYVLPVVRHLISRDALMKPHHDYPAWDLGLPMGTKVYAVHAGTVQRVTVSGDCGNGLEIAGKDGFVYTYCHGGAVAVRIGDRVKAGTFVMRSGNSGHSTGPHLHLQIRGAGVGLVCPQPLLASWYEGEQAGPFTSSGYGCSYATPDSGGKKGRGGRYARYLAALRRYRIALHRSQDRPGSPSPGSTWTAPAETEPQPESTWEPAPQPKPQPTQEPEPEPEPTPTAEPEASPSASP